MELEGTGRRDAEMLDRSKYPMLNINGAVIIRRDQVCYSSFLRNVAMIFIKNVHKKVGNPSLFLTIFIFFFCK